MRLLPALLLSFQLLCAPTAAAQTGEQEPPTGEEVKRAIREAGEGNITLPARSPARPGAKTGTALDFDVDVRRLRQAMRKDAARVAQALQALAAHGDPAGKAMARFPRARGSMLSTLMRVVEEFGTRAHADQLHQALLERNLRGLTAPVLQACLKHSGAAGRERLFVYLQSRFSRLRREAQNQLAGKLSAGDVPRLLALAQGKNQDLRRRCIELMAEIPDPRVRRFLVSNLGASAALSRSACRALLHMGEAAREELRAAAAAGQPGWALASLVLVESAAERESLDLPTALRERLPAALQQNDGVAQVIAAVCLAELSWRGETLPAAVEAAQLCEVLLGVVAPTRFVSGLSLLKPAAHRALSRLAGVDHGTAVGPWRSWWATAKDGFVPLRRSLSLQPGQGAAAELRLSAQGNLLVFRGPEAAAGAVPAEARVYILAGSELEALLVELRGQGFMAPGRSVLAQGEVWQLELRRGGQRVLERRPAAAAAIGPGDEAILNRLYGLARQELWQLHRPAAETPAAFWRAQRQRFAKGAGQAELAKLILHSIETRDDAGRKAALDDLLAIPDLARHVDQELANRLVARAAKLPRLDASDFRMLEVALLSKDSDNWRQALNALQPHLEGAGDRLVSRFFALLGPERLALAVLHPDPKLALAAIHDVARNEVRSAVPNLRRLLRSKRLDLCSTAVYALGVVHAREAVPELLAMERSAPASLRREIWKALCRLDEPRAVPLLRVGLRSKDPADQRAALLAMGLSRRPEFATQLAARFVAQDFSEGEFLSRRAELSLRQMGPVLAIPVLRPHLQMQAGPELDRLVLLLGSFQDPKVVPQLIEMLRRDKLRKAAAGLLEGCTGVDLGPLRDKPRQMTAWYATRGRAGQGQWFLDALRIAQLATELRPDELRPEAAPAVVLELARLLPLLEAPRLRVLCAALLRTCTARDFTRGVEHADRARLRSIADRYRYHAEALRKSGR